MTITLAQRERFLDHFPVSDNELDRLLSLYPHFAEISSAAADESSSDSAQDEKKDVGDRSPPTTTDAAAGIAEWYSNDSKVAAEEEHQQHESGQQRVLTSCERCFLPDLVSILREAVASVFLVGFSNETETIQEQATFLEAAVSLLGRRGDRFVRNVLFSTASSMNAAASGQPPREVRAATLVNLLYRLVLARSFLESNTLPNNQEPDGKSTTTSPATQQQQQQQLLLDAAEAAAASPMSWLRSINTTDTVDSNKLATTSTASDAENDIITLAMWNQWTTDTAPNIHQILSTVLHYFLLGGAIPRQTSSSSDDDDEDEEGIRIGDSFSFSLEQQQQQQEEAGAFAMRPEPMSLPIYDYPPCVFSAESDSLHHLVSFAAPLAAMTLGGNWIRIYSSSFHGLSFRSLQQALLGYAGPTVLLIRSTNGHVFGYFTEVAWKKSPHWYTGDGDAFLFTLHPVWKRYERTYDQECCSGSATKSPQLQYLNLPPANNRVGNYCRDLAGLAVGGVAHDAPRLHLTPSLEQCMACPMDRQFVSGPLLANEGPICADNDDVPLFFDVEELEVYAVRLDDSSTTAPLATFERAVAAGQLALDTAEAHRVRCAQVDKKQFVDDLINNAPPCSKLFAHREQARGRASFVADDDEEKGYFIHGKEPTHYADEPSQKKDDKCNDDSTQE